MRTDQDVIDLILARFGGRRRRRRIDSATEAAASLGLNNYQTLYNWRARGVPSNWRRAVCLWCRVNGIRISEEWCWANKTRAERAALKRSLRVLKNGGPNGRAGKGKPRQAGGGEGQQEGQRV